MIIEVLTCVHFKSLYVTLFYKMDEHFLSDFEREITKSIYFVAFLPCRPKSWIEEQEMGSFLSVAKGSDEPPVFLEIHYRGSPNASEPPLVFVGKGITFDRYVFTVSMLCILVNAFCALVSFKFHSNRNKIS